MTRLELVARARRKAGSKVRRRLVVRPDLERLEDWLSPNIWPIGVALLADGAVQMARAATPAARPVEASVVAPRRADAFGAASRLAAAQTAPPTSGRAVDPALLASIAILAAPSAAPAVAPSASLSTPRVGQPSAAAGGAQPGRGGAAPTIAVSPLRASAIAAPDLSGDGLGSSIVFASGATASTSPSAPATPAPATLAPTPPPSPATSTPAPASPVLGPVLSHVPLTFEALAAPATSYRFLGLDDSAIVDSGGVTLGLPAVDPQVPATPASPSFGILFVGANAHAAGQGIDPLYPAGNTATPSYASVHYSDAYPGVGINYHPSDRHLEYDFLVAPGADPSTIALGFEGAVSPELTDGGNLVLHAASGDLAQATPTIYQDTSDGRQPVAGQYVLRADHAIGFQVGTYDHGLPLVIDPLPLPTAPDPTSPLGSFAVAGEGSGAAGTATFDAVSGKVTGVTLDVGKGGSGYKFAPSVQLVGGGGSGATVIPTLKGAAVTGLRLDTGGSGYVVAPEIQFTGAGTGAMATATLTGDKVTGVTLDAGGSGYTPITSVSFLGERPAFVSATVVGGKVTALTLLDGGHGYVSTPLVIVRGDGAGARATATIAGGVVTGVTLTAMGAGYNADTTSVRFLTGLASQATATAAVAAGKVTGLPIVNGGLRYTTAPTVIIVGEGAGATATATIDASGTVDSLTVAVMGAGYKAATTSVVIIGTPGPEVPATGTATVPVGDGVLTGFTITTGDVAKGGSGYTSAPKVEISDNPETYHFDTLFQTDLAVPVELDGAVRRPKVLAGGPFPVVVFLHGNHDSTVASYLGYDYIAKTLASYGYFVDSISANRINGQNQGAEGGMVARAELIQEHLDIINALNTGGTKIPAEAGVKTATKSIAVPGKLLSSGVANTIFQGKLDLSNVGVMGHSRGGEAAVKEVSYNAGNETKKPERQYGIHAVFALAPTDFNRFTVRDAAGLAVPEVTLLPYVDGDVADLQGVHFYDDISPGGSSYDATKDNAPRHAILVQEANHNYFNTVWTPGNAFDVNATDDLSDIRGVTTPFPAADTDHKKLTPVQQMAVGNAYITGFFRIYIGGEAKFLPMFTGDASPPASVTPNIFATYSAAAALRTDINRLDATMGDTKTPKDANILGGKVTAVGTTMFEMYGGKAEQGVAAVFTAAVASGPFQLPHNSRAAPGLSQLIVNWDTAAASFTNGLAPAGRVLDASAATNLDFRAAVNFDSILNPDAMPQDFAVTLTDMAGRSQSINVSAVSDALFYPPGKATTKIPDGLGGEKEVGLLPKIVLNEVRIPLKAFPTFPAFPGGVDLTRLVSLKFDFNKTTKGSLLFSDIHFDGKAVAASLPSTQIQIQRFGFAKVVRPDKSVHFLQQVVLTNPSDTDIAGPVSLVLDRLSPAAMLSNRTGLTATMPIGSPFLDIVPAGGSFFGGSSITVTLDFTNVNPALGITYATRIVAGPGVR